MPSLIATYNAYRNEGAPEVKKFETRPVAERRVIDAMMANGHSKVTQKGVKIDPNTYAPPVRGQKPAVEPEAKPVEPAKPAGKVKTPTKPAKAAKSLKTPRKALPKVVKPKKPAAKPASKPAKLTKQPPKVVAPPKPAEAATDRVCPFPPGSGNSVLWYAAQASKPIERKARPEREPTGRHRSPKFKMVRALATGETKLHAGSKRNAVFKMISDSPNSTIGVDDLAAKLGYSVSGHICKLIISKHIESVV